MASFTITFAENVLVYIKGVDVNDILVLSNGKILIGGDFYEVNGVTMYNLCLLNSDGTVDTSFSPGTSTDGPVNCLMAGSSFGTFVGGDFSTYQGTSTGPLIKIDNTGNRITSFSANGTSTYQNSVYALNMVQRTTGTYEYLIVGGDIYEYRNSSVEGLFVVREDTGELLRNLGSLILPPGENTLSIRAIHKSNNKLFFGGSFIVGEPLLGEVSDIVITSGTGSPGILTDQYPSSFTNIKGVFSLNEVGDTLLIGCEEQESGGTSFAASIICVDNENFSTSTTNRLSPYGTSPGGERIKVNRISSNPNTEVIYASTTVPTGDSGPGIRGVRFILSKTGTNLTTVSTANMGRQCLVTTYHDYTNSLYTGVQAVNNGDQLLHLTQL